MKQKKVLLLGTYGQTNLGDDLLMYNMLSLLESKGYTKIYVNISDRSLIPREVHERFGGLLELHETYKTSPFAWLGLLSKVEAIVYGGGTIFKDLYSSTGRGKHGVVLRIAIINTLARVMGVRVYHMCIGIGSIRSSFGRFLTKLSLNVANQSYFRDEQSYEYAKDVLKVSPHKITQSTDGIFLGTDWGEPTHVTLPGRSNRPVIGVNALSDIPDWIDRADYIREMRELVTKLVDMGAFIVFIPFQTKFNPNSDLNFINKELAGALSKDDYVIYDQVSLSSLAPLFEKIDYFVGMRFHSLLVSAIHQVPFLALEYDTKCTRLMEEMNYPFTLSLEKFNSSDAIQMIAKIQKTDKSRIQKLQQKYIESQKDIIKETLTELKL